MDKIFELLNASNSDEDTLNAIISHLDGNHSFNFLEKQARMTGYTHTKSVEYTATTPLHLALEKKKWKCAHYLLGRKMQALNVFPDDFGTPLHRIAECDSLEFQQFFWSSNDIVNEIRSWKPEVINKRNEKNETPLMVSVRTQKEIKWIEVWFKFSPDYCMTDEKGRNAFHLAIEYALPADVLNCLLKACPDFMSIPMVAVGQNKRLPPIHIAAKKNNTVAINTLISAGAGVNCRDDDFNTPLITAARDGSIATMRCLLDHKAEVNARNTLNESPLHVVLKNPYAYASGTEQRLEMAVSLLLENGADLYAMDSKVKTAWDLVVDTFPNEKEMRRQFYEAVEKHNARNPSPEAIASVVFYLQIQASHILPETLQQGFNECLNYICTPQIKSRVSFFWAQQQSASNLHVQNKNTN